MSRVEVVPGGVRAMAMRLGSYVVLAQVGAGPDGEAYRAREPGDGRLAEVRVLAPARADPARWNSLCKRVRAASLIDHPASARVREFRDDGDPPYLVLDWSESRPLRDALADRVPLPEAEVVAIVLDLAWATSEAHRLGLTHGAIGPATARVDGSGRPMLDFTGTDTGPAPARAVDPAEDVRGLGLVLHWLMVGATAADEPAPLGGLSSVTREHVPGDTADLTLDLDRLAREMLSADPGDRPPAREVVFRLDALAAAMLHALPSETVDSVVLAQTGELAPLSASASSGGFSLRASGPGARAGGHDPAALADILSRDRLGRYRLLEKIGQGGMGAVFRGEDMADGTVVALKVLRPEWAAKPGAFRRFRKEARLLGEVNNPFVTNLLEVNEDDGIHFLVLEFVSGRSLDRILADRGKLAESEAIAILADVARALVDAHEKGIVHRDVKPDNILITEPADGSPRRVKLSDFGLARHVVESESLQVTQPQAVVGTPQYMAPEQGVGGAIGPRADVYAMGITLYHMLAGQVPFTASRLMDMIALHCNEPPPPLEKFRPDASDGVRRILDRALAKDPGARFADAGAFLADLERLSRGEPTPDAAHPKLPQCDPKDLLQFDFSWDLEASPRLLWPLVTNTERLNRAIGLPPVTFRIEADAAGQVRRFGESKQGGMTAEWEEHPYEWVEPRRMGVLRQYRRGPFKWMLSAVELTPRPRGGTTLVHRVRILPRGALMRAAASLKVGRDSRRALERVYRRIDASLTGKLSGGATADPFEDPAPLTMPRRRRLERLLDVMGKHGIHPAVVEKFGDFLATAPAQEVTRIRPLALARRLGLDASQVISACLHGARDGLLVLLWDILCPICRVPSEVQDTLRALKDHGRCEACQLDFDLDFANSVEMIFRVHPEVRDAELGIYCIGGPAHSPHVMAQVRVAPNERIELELGLSEGTYQVRGPQLPHAREFHVDPSTGARRLALDLGQGAASRVLAPLRAGGQTISLKNEFDQELVVRVERTASRDDALTAARASALALFRDLFPGEILSPGQLISIATTTLMVTTLDGADALYAEAGDARAFAAIHEHFRLIEDRIRRDGGALVKTINEGVLAAFADSAAAVRIGLDLPQILAAGELARNLGISAAVHRGPAMAATINDHLDYFGLTVAQTSALLRRANRGELILSQAVATDPSVVATLRARKREGEVFSAALPGDPQAVIHRLMMD